MIFALQHQLTVTILRRTATVSTAQAMQRQHTRSARQRRARSAPRHNPPTEARDHGDKIMDVVPDRESLVVEAQVAVEDISEVHPDMRAEVHLTAYKQRTTPIVHGDVLQVSADRLTDTKNNSYYIALVRVDESELADLPHIRLYPGMPATVMIPTIDRTALDYLLGPLVMSFNHAFRQR
jgi:HlyD family secretion protein